MSDESTLQRRRQAEAWDALDRTPSATGDGGDHLVCKTVAIAAYPTVAAAYYGVVACDVGGAEQEGQPGTVAAVKGAFLALNVGTTIPPVGAIVLVFRPGARHVFRYCG